MKKAKLFGDLKYSAGCRNYIIKSFTKYVFEILTELGLRNCQGIGEYGYRHLSRLKNLQYLDLYRTLVDLLSLKAILKQSQNLKHINMGKSERTPEVQLFYYEAFILPYFKSKVLRRINIHPSKILY